MGERFEIILNDSKFKRLEEEMGAAFKPWKPDVPDLSPPPPIDIQLEESGIEVEIDEIEINENRLFSYKGHHVVIYIKETGDTKETLLINPENSKKVHLIDCRKIRQMKKDSRFQRYVATTRKDGLFNVDSTEIDGTHTNLDAHLKVCRYCLYEIEWANYQFQRNDGQRNEIVKQFNFKTFFIKNQTYFSEIPNMNREGVVTTGYADNHDEVSREIRRSREWKCEKCYVDLTDHKYLLDMHHDNGVKNNNQESNLWVLCKLCHKEQPQHHHYYVKPEDELKIKELRSQQDR